MFLTKTSERMYEIYDMIFGPGRKFHPVKCSPNTLVFSLCSVYPLLFPHQIGWALLPDPATQLENRFHLSVLHPGLRKPGSRIHIGSGASWALKSLCSPRQLQLPSPTSPTSQLHQQSALRLVTEEIYVTCLALHLCGSPGP